MDAKGLVVLPGQGPVWNMAPGRSATLKLQSSQTAESVMMFEEAAPAGTVTNFHLHRDSDEVAYILSGQVTFKIGDQTTVGGPGTCAFIPRGIAHAWKSTGKETGRVLFIFTPAEAGKAFEELQQLQCPVGSMAAPVFQRHGAEVVGCRAARSTRCCRTASIAVRSSTRDNPIPATHTDHRSAFVG